jgi:hypothetical protein
MSPTLRRRWLPLACALMLVGMSATHAQTNGGFTEDEITQRLLLNHRAGARTQTREDVINELASDKAAEHQVYVSPADLDAAFLQACARWRVTPEDLTKRLDTYFIRLDTLKARIKGDVARAAWARLRSNPCPDEQSDLFRIAACKPPTASLTRIAPYH